MKYIDYHIHTFFSADSEENPRNHIKQAIALGLDEICFTDHQDFKYPGTSFDLDVEAYQKEIYQLKKEYQDKITIKWGIEIGLDINYKDQIHAFINQYPFDFIIGSIHVIQDTEFYDPALFFKNKSKEQAHQDFFQETLACVKAFNCFNVLGHLDYIVRYGPYENTAIDYTLYQDNITKILEVLIKKKKGIEVNTSGFKVHKTCGFPNFDIVKQYYDMGGRIITIGTDSHTSECVGENVKTVMKKYQEIGFKDVSTFTNRMLDT